MERILKRFGKQITHFRWVVIGLWLMLLVFGGYYATQVGSHLTGGGWGVPGSDSNQAYEVLSEEFESRDATSLTFVMSHEVYQVGSDEYTEAFKLVSQSLQNEPEIDQVYTWLDVEETTRGPFVSEDAYTSIGFIEVNVDEGFAQKVLPDIQERLTASLGESGFEATILGAPAFWGEMNELSQAGLEKAHFYAFPIIVIVLLFVFRSVVSSITPLLLSGFSIAASLGILHFIAQGMELSIFVLDAALMLGIGVGIDFALIFVKRFREELEKSGDDTALAVSETMGTAGHAILFSGITIIVAMSAVLFVDIAAVRSIALGVIVVVFFLILTSLTLLPVFLTIVGPKINAWKVPFLPIKEARQNEKGTWYRLAHRVMRRPVLYLTMSVVFLLALAWPALELEVSTPDARMLPEDTQVRKGLSHLEEGFGIGYSAPIQVVVSAEEGQLIDESGLEELQNIVAKIEEMDNVEGITSLFSLFPNFTVEQIERCYLIKVNG
ncbi:MMPL family transporter [Bacillus sp. JCM 19041]|uniref:MMPL family transporter n=1 Tax=Bacillus sp. JCM 19041 TaxID=1460637 RepID=UPI0006D12E56